jgi:glutaredoxin
MAKVSTGEIVSLLTLGVVLALLVLLVLSLTGTMTLCGSKGAAASGTAATAASSAAPRAARTRSARKKMAAPSPSPAAAAAAAAPAPSPAAAPAATDLLSMEAPEAVKEVRAGGRDRVLYVLGQNSCPACVACKKYLAEHGAGDVAVFVDLNKHAAMLKDGSLPQGVPQSLGRGVPCLVAYSHRSGAVMKKSEGFSPKSVDELLTTVRG